MLPASTRQWPIYLSFLPARADNAFFPLSHRCAHLFGEMPVFLDMAGHAAGRCSQQIGCDQDFAVAIRAGTDADGREWGFLR